MTLTPDENRRYADALDVEYALADEARLEKARRKTRCEPSTPWVPVIAGAVLGVCILVEFVRLAIGGGC